MHLRKCTSDNVISKQASTGWPSWNNCQLSEAESAALFYALGNNIMTIKVCFEIFNRMKAHHQLFHPFRHFFSVHFSIYDFMHVFIRHTKSCLSGSVRNAYFRWYGYEYMYDDKLMTTKIHVLLFTNPVQRLTIKHDNMPFDHNEGASKCLYFTNLWQISGMYVLLNGTENCKWVL